LLLATCHNGTIGLYDCDTSKKLAEVLCSRRVRQISVSSRCFSITTPFDTTVYSLSGQALLQMDQWELGVLLSNGQRLLGVKLIAGDEVSCMIKPLGDADLSNSTTTTKLWNIKTSRRIREAPLTICPDESRGMFISESNIYLFAVDDGRVIRHIQIPLLNSWNCLLCSLPTKALVQDVAENFGEIDFFAAERDNIGLLCVLVNSQDRIWREFPVHLLRVVKKLLI